MMVTSAPALPSRHEYTGLVRGSANSVFAYLDDHAKLSSHMSRRSWMMVGGRMETEVDQLGGHGIGSHIRLEGKVAGIRLAVEELVTDYNPPSYKAWETIGEPRLVVIGHYRMGFELSPKNGVCSVRVFISYALPEKAPWRWLARTVGPIYAAWCTRRMVRDVAAHFGGG